MPQPEFLFDENVPEAVARALQALGVPVRYAPSELGRGAKDETVFEAASRNGWFLVTQDRRMATNKLQRAAIVEAGIGVFVFTGTASRSLTDLAAFVLSRMERIRELAGKTRPPFVFRVPDRGAIERLV